ncbi:MAG: branched-chain amino acid transporter substrate-binding protein [Paenibacillus sp.]|nr:branched-chain amino acid transporter substrate-binding protein [Paenibacillus sp.]
MNKKKLKLSLLTLSIMVTGSLLAGCVNNKGDAVAGASKVEAPKEIVIGAIYPLTGNSATVGQQNKVALELAADIINNNVDLDLPFAKTEGIPNLNNAKIKLVFADSQGKPDVAANEAQRLISREKASIILGAYASSNAATVAQVTERNGVPFLIPDSNSPSLTEQGYKWLFRIAPTENTHINDAFNLLDELKQKGKNINSVAILNENSLWGTDIAKEQLKQAEKRGYKVAAHVEYPQNTTDLNSEVQKIKASKPDVLLISAYTSDALLFVKTTKELNFQPQAILASGAGFVDNTFKEKIGDQARDVITRDLWSLDLADKKPIYAKLNEEFKKKSQGRDLLGDQAKVIQGLLVAADVLNRAKSTDPKALQEALSSTDIPEKDLVMPWDGVKFDPKTHQNEKAKGVLMQFAGGKYSTVYPFNLAKQEIKWPFTPWDQRK